MPERHRDWAERRVSLSADGEGRFVLMERYHRTDPHRYSCQLLYIDEASVTHHLLRVGSKRITHTNRLERRTITDTRRVNRLTARYQEAAGEDPDIHDDGYAV
jgi:hypothetical protein